MNSQQSKPCCARAAAGDEVLHIVQANGVEASAETLREYMRAFFIGYVTVAGWDSALNLVQQLSHDHFASISREKKVRLVICNVDNVTRQRGKIKMPVHECNWKRITKAIVGGPFTFRTFHSPDHGDRASRRTVDVLMTVTLPAISGEEHTIIPSMQVHL